MNNPRSSPAQCRTGLCHACSERPCGHRNVEAFPKGAPCTPVPMRTGLQYRPLDGDAARRTVRRRRKDISCGCRQPERLSSSGRPVLPCCPDRKSRTGHSTVSGPARGTNTVGRRPALAALRHLDVTASREEPPSDGRYPGSPRIRPERRSPRRGRRPSSPRPRSLSHAAGCPSDAARFPPFGSTSRRFGDPPPPPQARKDPVTVSPPRTRCRCSLSARFSVPVPGFLLRCRHFSSTCGTWRRAPSACARCPVPARECAG